MIALVVLACLSSDPTQCSTTTIALAQEPSELGCGVLPSDRANAWAAAHPDFVVSRHWCVPAARLNQLGVPARKVLALDPCLLRDRRTANLWAERNPGVTAAQACASKASN